MQTGILYLIPSSLGSKETDHIIPSGVKKIIASLEYFIVENEKSARHFLKNLDMGILQQSLKISEIDKHDVKKDYSDFVEPALSGNHIGLLSEAGMPAVADPGAGIVHLAHKKNIKVVPLTGPSSMLLALMGSGLNGQSFCFHGYLPVEKDKRKLLVKKLEQDSFIKKQTQIFIETPYRNLKMFEDIVSVCEPRTLLCIAADITLPSEMIFTKMISEWKKNIPDLHKRPAVFLLMKQ